MRNRMHKLRLLLPILAMIVLSFVLAMAQENQELPKITVREIFVPSGEMATLLESCKDRVLLSRDEFESLLIESIKQKEAEPEAEPPVASVFLSSDLAIVIEGEQAKIKAVLEWDSLTDKLHAEPLDFNAVAIQSATFNGQPAQFGVTNEAANAQNENAKKQYTLFWQGKGRQRLELELTTALIVDSVRQELAFNIPRAPKATETLIVPGDVELKSGAMVVSRKVEGEGLDRRTHFELLANEAQQHLVLTLNSHRTRMIRSVLAKSVQFAEVTEHYEKLHATFSLDVLHQPINAAEFVVPPTFEMTEVNSPQLARWGLVERDGHSILEVRFREPINGQVSLNLTAVHFFDASSTAETLAEWAFPIFEPLEVNANSAVFGLLLDAGWNAHKIDAEKLIAIAPQILNRTIPDSVFEASVDAPAVRTVAAWYAPNTDDFRITCEFLKPKAMFDVVSHQVLTLSDREQTLRGLMQVAPRYEKIFELNLDVPSDWTVTRVTNESDVPLPFEQKGDRVRVKITSGIAAGTIFPMFFEASGNTPGWFGDWEKQQLPFPRFCVVDAAGDSGTVAVDVDEDMIATSENNVRLVPLDNKERTEFLAGVPTDLAFRYLSQPYSTDLSIARATPRLTARTFAFFGFAPSLMSSRYELHYAVEQAKAKSLAFLLPVETPDNITIRGLNVAIKDYAKSDVTVDGKQYRRWDVQLADPMRGQLMLAVDFEQAIPDETTQSLPLATACDVAWQTGLVSVEGHEELNLKLDENANTQQPLRKVDVGELAATQYIPGKRLLGVFEGVTDENALNVVVTRNPDFQLPVSIVQLARADVEIATGGKRITRAVYDLKTRATFLKIDLAANEEIWAVSLDGNTIKPQKSGSAIMVDISARDDAAIRELEVVWATQEPTRSAKLFASSAVRLPDLMLPQNTENASKTEKAESKEQNAVVWKKIPVTRIAWNVTAPPGYEVTRIGNRRIETETPRPIVLQYMSKMFTSLHMPNIACSAPKSAEMFHAASTLRDVPYAEAPAEDMAFESAELSTMAYDTLEADSLLAEKNKKSDRAFESKDESSIRVRQSLEEDNSEVRRQPLSSSPLREGKTGDLSKAVVFDTDSGLVGRFAQGRGEAVPYQNRTLQTVRPVQVQFQQNLSSPLQRHVQFQLVGGSESQLKVRMVNTRIVTVGMYFVWGGVLCAGLCLLKASRRVRAIYVLAVLSLGTLLVLVPRLEMFADLFDEAVKAGFWVFLIYILVGGYRMIQQYRISVSAVTVATLALLVFAAMNGTLQANDASNDASAKAVSLPNDAIVAFYNAESLLAAPLLENGLPDPKSLSRPDQKLLVPYAKYVELWQLVHPEAKIEPVVKPPVDYVTTFGEYRATLSASDELSITGKTEIEVLTDEPVIFPLPIGGGILTALQVDGKIAQVSITPQAVPLAQNDQALAQQQPDPQQTQQQMIAPPQMHGGVFVLQIHGKGKHVIDLTAKYKVERQGGWRLTTGRLPEFPAGKVLLELPEDRMELRCKNMYAQQKWQAQTPGETIETSLGRAGHFNWSWRSKVTEGEVDQSLTADSELRFNVQEDALMLEWDLTLAFRRGKHESFRLRIPADYLVVSIGGENVRGWENAPIDNASDTPNESLIDVELLHTAQEVEQFNIVLMRKADFAEANNVSVTTPNVAVVGAAMHHGRITLQNSPRLDIKAGELTNASMTDLPETSNNPNARKTTSDNPLGLKPYRAYRFTTENYQLPMTVSVVTQKPQCTLQSIIKLAANEINVEVSCQLNMQNVQTEKRFCEYLILPIGLQLKSVQSEMPIEWSTKLLESGETELTVIWSTIPGLQVVTFNLLGTIMRDANTEADLPVVMPQDRERSIVYDVVIQCDPAFDVGIRDLKDCSEQQRIIPSWVVAAQHSLCRKHLWNNTSNPEIKPSAKLSLIAREPVITSSSITNVQVNSRSVEETILLDFNIQNAGIRSVQFELPKSMADAKIDAPLLQRKEITDNENGNAVNVTLWLQDEIMNEFRVLIRNNRELVADQSYAATIPNIQTGTVLNQFVVLENAGSFDELQVDAAKLSGMQKISRQNKEWGNLAAILGGGATEAYLVAEKTNPKLSFNMVRRETVAMSGARIGLAETRVVLGENGDYLAEQIYRIDNKTEQFLDLKLPTGAELWAVRLLTNQEWDAKQSGAAGDFGQPVKPTTIPTQNAERKTQSKEDANNNSALYTLHSALPNSVRIPIIKTEVGDLDYVVRIVYAGKCKPIRWTAKLDIPFIEVLNIPVGASYAKLHLPENYNYQFDGTMSESDQGSIAKTNSEYEKQIVAKLQQAAQTGNPYEQARAMSNLKLKGIMQQSRSREYTVNTPVWETRVHQEMQTNQPTFGGYQAGSNVSGTMPTISALSNSVQLEQRFESQSNARGTNVISQSESNWNVENGKPISAIASEPVNNASGQQFNTEWLGKNSLENPKSGNSFVGSTSDLKKPASNTTTPARPTYANTSPLQESNEENTDMFALRIGVLPESGESSSRVSRESRQLQQVSPQSLKEQERLNDSAASKLSGNRQSANFQLNGQVDSSRPVPQQQMPSQMQQPSSQQTGNNVELYQQRLVEQNANVQVLPQRSSPQMPTLEVNQPLPSGDTGMMNSGMAMSGMGSSQPQTSGMVIGGSPVPAGGPGQRQFGGYGGGMGAGGYGGGGMSGGRPMFPAAEENFRRNSSSSVGSSSAMASDSELTFDSLSQTVLYDRELQNNYFVMGERMATKTASLDIEIPQTGTVYFFTAPQAENRLSVSGISNADSQRTKDFGRVLAIITVCAIVGFLIVRRTRSRNGRF